VIWELYLSRSSDFLAIETEMIGVGYHIFKHKDSLRDERFIVVASSGECFDEPESAHGKRSFATADTVFGEEMVI
jgi:hypothetical protein